MLQSTNKNINLVYFGDPISRQSFRAFYRNGKVNFIDPQINELMSLKADTIGQLPKNFKIWSKNNPVFVYIDCYFKIPISWNNEKKELALSGEMNYIKVPDCDNIAKLFMDVMKGIIFYDDAQVIGLLITKRYDLVPRVNISTYIK